MSITELEHATTSHFRFNSRLMKELSFDTQLQPVSIQILQTEEHLFEKFTLIPGGRFLLSVSFPDEVQLWDLGSSVDRMIINSPLASVTVPNLIIPESLGVQSIVTSDGKGLLLFTVATPTGPFAPGECVSHFPLKLRDSV